MTEEQIIKALECCECVECNNCPLKKENDCLGICRNEAINIINRQKAEIERLKKSYLMYEETSGIKEFKDEAKELKYAYDRCMEEKEKLGIRYEEALMEIEKQKSRVDFLLGQIEGYQYCIDMICGGK